MSKLYVNPYEVRRANYRLRPLEAQVSHVRADLRKIKGKIPLEISQKRQIRQRIGQVCSDISRLERKIEELYEITGSCMEQYEYAELKNTENAKMFY